MNLISIAHDAAERGPRVGLDLGPPPRGWSGVATTKVEHGLDLTNVCS
jgi:hypothetical protein